MEHIIHLFYIHYPEKLSENIFEEFLLRLPIYHQKEIKDYVHRQSAQSSLLGKILLQYAFKQLNLNNSLANIKLTEKGKPYINETIDFNISHSGNCVVCAITQQAKVGIDIEKHRLLKQDIATRYFTPQECNEIKNSYHAQSSFFDMWAIKESAIKCDGRGVEVLSQTYIKDVETNGLQMEGLVICDNKEFYYRQIYFIESYSGAVCSTMPFETQVIRVELADLE